MNDLASIIALIIDIFFIEKGFVRPINLLNCRPINHIFHQPAAAAMRDSLHLHLSLSGIIEVQFI